VQQVIYGLFVLLFVFYFIKAAPFENNMYPYGSQQNDEEFGLEDSPYFYYGHCLRIDTDFTGFPFFSERHYKLYVSIEYFQNDSLQPCWHPKARRLPSCSVFQANREGVDLFYYVNTFFHCNKIAPLFAT